MKRRNVTIFTSILLAPLSLILSILPSVSLAGETKPELYRPKASPAIVHFGAQPEGSPLLLTIEAKGPGGEIATIAVNLSKLIEAKYYDPISDTIKEVSGSTPLLRVYEIEGKEAYLVEVGSRYEYNEYETALTYERVRGTAVATNKWQVELPYVGHVQSAFALTVTATNRYNRQNATISN